MYIPHMTQVTKHANEAMVINIRTLVAWLQGDWLERDLRKFIVLIKLFYTIVNHDIGFTSLNYTLQICTFDAL